MVKWCIPGDCTNGIDAMTPSSTMDGNVSCFTLARRSPEEQAVLREALENSLHLLTMRYELVQVSVISASNVHDLLIQTKPLWDEWAMATMMRDNPLLSASLELENLFGTWADAALHYLARASNERLLWAPLHMADASLGDKLIKVGIHDSLRSRSDSVRSMVDDGGFSD
ncbi:hypothetical protein BDV95DRAFT_16903 [Massariosphaeria phaeospora]|uniref:Uncharacterized protein n=1 Tax=Massariosphaeria phaeospora TaxID=100035 RepID=A0A7C8MVX9_9PLEO|nr:hypothetical protein BDV95DRAFT_16903 [Massariosphaeria phaeospora]